MNLLREEDQHVYVKLTLYIQFGYSILHLGNGSLENGKQWGLNWIAILKFSVY